MDARPIHHDDEAAFDHWCAVVEATDDERWGDPLGGTASGTFWLGEIRTDVTGA